MAEKTIKMITKEDVKSIRFVQNISKSQLIIPDLGTKGFVLEADETVDLKRFFSEKELAKSQQLDWCLREKKINVLEYDIAEDGQIKLKGIVEEETKPRGEDLPKSIPVEDRESTPYDEKLDEVEDREQQEDEDTRLNKKRNRDRKKEQEKEEK